jgi:hypothetical protein
MLNRTPPSSPSTHFDPEIERVLKELKAAKPDSKEYSDLLERLTKLHKLRVDDHNMIERRKQVSPDTVLGVCANIFGILWLSRYEKENVIKAKEAMKMVIKPRS